MIGKKIPNPKKSTSAKVRIKKLADYIKSPESAEGKEKCVISASRNFISKTHKGRIAEMQALAMSNRRCRDPIVHYALSWREGERPRADQIEQTVDVLLECLGALSHQVIYGLHADTDNYHLHAMLNRIDPVTEKVVRLNNNFDIEALHQAVALIEHNQGWKRESNTTYLVNENGILQRMQRPTGRPGKPDARALAMEVHTGLKSAQRLAIEQAWPVISTAQRWEQMHTALVDIGMRYQKVRRGAVVWVGDVPVKASTVDRNAGLTRLEQRLGPYEPCTLAGPASHVLPPKASIPAVPLVPGVRQEYLAGRRKRLVSRKQALGSARLQHTEEQHALRGHQRAERERLLSGNWKGKGLALNALRFVLARRHAEQMRALVEIQSMHLRMVRQTFPPCPDYTTWLRDNMQADDVTAWRYRNSNLWLGNRSGHGQLKENKGTRMQ